MAFFHERGTPAMDLQLRPKVRRVEAHAPHGGAHDPRDHHGQRERLCERECVRERECV